MRFGATRRSLTLILLSFLAVSAGIWIALLLNAASLETRIARDWMVLVDRCRTSVETGASLNISGLQPAEILRVGAEMSAPLHQRVLAFPNGRYAIEESEFATREGTQRSCSVRIRDYRDGPTKREAAVLFYDFAQLAHELYRSETHWGAEILAGPQFAAHAFEPRAPRPDGCRVKSSVLVVLETHEVVAATVETEGCGGPSLLATEAS